MNDEIDLGGRYFARAMPRNMLNHIQEGAEIRVTFLDATDVSFEMIRDNGSYPKRNMRIARMLFREHFMVHIQTLPSRGYVKSKHFDFRYK
ncbi:hypothetical protein J3454_07090 [Erythrobacter sp. NFXS35]|uniref:hypothetical protein n=1 Tax=Erythrobacter sp. NFXS35 TaxID=2818436 RepID=UPI0032E03750